MKDVIRPHNSARDLRMISAEGMLRERALVSSDSWRASTLMDPPFALQPGDCLGPRMRKALTRIVTISYVGGEGFVDSERSTRDVNERRCLEC